MKKILIGFAVVLAAGVALGAERVPGTNVLLDPPEGFRKAVQFPGYMMESTGASIMVTEIPGPYSELSKGMTREGLATRGVELRDKKSARIAPGAGTLIHARQVANDIPFLKWMLVFGDEEASVMLVASFPEQLESELSEQLRKALLSVKWDRDAKVDLFEGLTFRVQEKGDLKIAKKIANLLALTRDGVFPQQDLTRPLVLVGPSFTEDWEVPGDKLEYSRARLGISNAYVDPVILAETTIQIDGLESCVIEGEAKEIETGTPLHLLHCLLFTKDGYYIFQGMVDAKDKEKYAPVFRSILKSFKRQQLIQN